MKRYLIFLVFVVAVFVVSCGSTSKSVTPKVSRQEIVIIEHKGTSFGADIPQWVMKALDSANAVEKMPEYAGRYAFIADQRGQDLSGLQTWANNFTIQPMVASRIDNTVEAAFKGGQAGDVKKVGEYFQRYVETRTSVNFTGLVKEGEWWVRTRERSGEYYRYIVLYTVDKNILDKQIEEYMNQKFGGSIGVTRDAEELENIDVVKEIVRKGGLN